MCEPPCRSRPSTTCRCAHAGQRFTVDSGKKFGTANMQTMNAVSKIAVAFHVEIFSMMLPAQRSSPPQRSDRSAADQVASVSIPKLASLCDSVVCELRNPRTVGQYGGRVALL